MKRYIAATLALLATATVSMAQLSGTLTIQGTVASVVSITVAPVAGYDSLDIVNGVTAQTVANLTERCNHKPGYTVTMTSLNAGAAGNTLFLADTAGGAGTDTVPYSLTYNGVPVTFASGSATLTDTNAKTPSAGVTKPLAVTLAASWVAQATYADTLTFTIAGK